MNRCYVRPCEDEVTHIFVDRSHKRCWLVCDTHFDWYKRKIEINPKYVLKYYKGRLTLCFSGEFAFRMYNQEGYPLELLELQAEWWGMGVDIEEFNRRMELQKIRSKCNA